MISFIVQRMHIGTTTKQMVREFHTRFKKFSRKNRVALAPREDRRRVYREAIDEMRGIHEVLKGSNLL